MIRNARIVLPIAIAQACVYTLLNQNPLLPSRTLPLTWIDEATPFLPWTVWPYLALAIAPIGLALLIQSASRVRETLVVYVPAMLLTFAVHLAWPTHIERPQPNGDFCYELLMQIDAPFSCFPSGHIVSPFILCWAYWRDGRPGGLFLLVLFPVWSMTILTTKQHYLWDWLGGYVIGAAAIGCAYILDRRSVTTSHSNNEGAGASAGTLD